MKINSKNLIILALSISLLMIIISGCTQKAGNDTPPIVEVPKTDDINPEETTTGVISTEDLKSKIDDNNWVIIDTRINDAYNGWRLDGVARGGHIKNAVDFSANWLSVEAEDKVDVLDKALLSKGIKKERNIVLYDANGKDATIVKDYLSNKGYENLFTYDVKEWANDSSLPMEQYENYQLIVPAVVIKEILDGKTPETFENAKNIKMVEASWGEEETSYANGHIPTSVHVNTDTIEPPPAWMLGTDVQLTQFALDYGFTKDDTIIVTGEATMASYRVALVLRYMGVKDVRVLNGGLAAWKAAGYDVETESHKPTPGTDFGAIIPANPAIVDTIEETKIGLKDPDKFTLVDNRTWKEHIGESSGYSYHDKKGRIPGSVFGYAGIKDSNSLEYYRNIDNTMRNKDEILELWDIAGLDLNKHLSFMCGSGWRVAEILYYANIIGLEDVAIYSDGWIGWSTNPENPVETGVPK